MTLTVWQRGKVAAAQWGRGCILCHATTLTLCVVLIGACGGSTKTASEPTIGDSAGVTIVENRAPVWQKDSGWTLTPQPTASIGVLNGAPEYQLFRVSGAVRLSDGTIVVANGGSYQLRLYDRAGHYLKAFGRQGGGPGEFMGLGTIFRERGDTIAVTSGPYRLSLFTEKDGFVRAEDLSWFGPAVSPFPIGAFDDGSVLFRLTSNVPLFLRRELKPGPNWDSVTYVRTDRMGRFVDTVGLFLGVERLLVKSGNMTSLTPMAFARAGFIAVDDSLAVFGVNDSYAFEMLDGDGHVHRIVRRSYVLPPVTDEDVSRYKQGSLAPITNDNERRFQERVLEDMPFPKTFPAYRRLKVDALGDVWVKAYPTPGDSSNAWTVFNRDGWMLGPVTVPRGFEVSDIGANYVLGIWRDENDVEHVMEYGIRKPEVQTKEGS